jgi:hypothetical protein
MGAGRAGRGASGDRACSRLSATSQRAGGVLPFDTAATSKMCRAVDRFLTAVRTPTLTHSGDERLTVAGQVTVPSAIDPLNDGFRFQVEDPQGNILFERTVPEQAFWTVNGAGTRWTFKDTDGIVFPGSTKVTVQATRTPGVYKFRVTAKDDDFQLAGADLPVRLFVTSMPFDSWPW